MIPAAKFNETLLKGILISGVSDREEQGKKGSGKQNLHLLNLNLEGNKARYVRQSAVQVDKRSRALKVKVNFDLHKNLSF
jgi:hypothetical protein